jgi:hypothetical protein
VDRLAALAAGEREAGAKVAPLAAREDSRTHQGELMASHRGAPSVEVQNATHGAPSPEPDHGTDDRTKYAG